MACCVDTAKDLLITKKIINILTVHHTHTFSFFFKNKKKYKE